MNEKILYYREVTRGQQAKILAINMVFLPIILWFFLQFFRENQLVYERFLFYVGCIIIISEIGLASVIFWFVTHPAKFFIKLTNFEFTSHHPMFKQWTFSVNPQEIAAIEYRTDREANASIIAVKMVNGTSFLLSPNYAYNRKELYGALILLNPNIKIPKNFWVRSDKG